jgi:hypothetical protein
MHTVIFLCPCVFLLKKENNNRRKMPMSKLPQIQEETAALAHDIRAEALVAQILECGIGWQQLIAHTDQFFHRSYSRDVFFTELGDTPVEKEILHLHLTRAGIFDVLPEGLFFAPPASSTKSKTIADMVKEYADNKQQEAEVRKFFSPLEHEFFYHRYLTFNAETALLRGLNNAAVHQYFIRFWQLPPDMDAGMAMRLILLLPYTHQVAGDAERMAAFLQTITGETVSCRCEWQTRQNSELYYNRLGHYCLGDALTCGSAYEEEEVFFVFTLTHLRHAFVHDYLEGGKLFSVLQTFYRFFVPAGAGVKTEFQLTAERENMHIGQGEEATLGIATIL